MNCPKCKSRMILDPEWLPPPGMDPRMSRWYCKKTYCGTFFFQRLSMPDDKEVQEGGK